MNLRVHKTSNIVLFIPYTHFCVYFEFYCLQLVCQQM